MKIYFNGCSQVENGHLHLEQDWQNKIWPKLIADSLSAEYRNDAISLSSNNRILRTTIDSVLEWNPDLVIIGITAMDRVELPMSNGDRCRINPFHCNTDNGSTQIDYFSYWYKTHYNEWLAFCDTLRILYELQLISIVHKFRLLVFDAVCHNYFNDWQKLLEHSYFVKNKNALWRTTEEQAKIRRMVEKIQSLDWIIPQTTSLFSICKNNHWETDKFGHPALSSQQKVADLFLDYIKQNVSSV